MKKIILAVFCAFMLSITAMAQFTGPGATNETTVSEALKMADDAVVTLTGRIEKRISGDKYQFRDETGVITIEIDDKLWNNFTVGPEDTVIITGEIDKELMKPNEVDVKTITKK